MVDLFNVLKVLVFFSVLATLLRANTFKDAEAAAVKSAYNLTLKTFSP